MPPCCWPGRIAPSGDDRAAFLRRHGLAVEIVGAPGREGCAVEPRRWKVGQTFGCLPRYRRLRVDDEMGLEVLPEEIVESLATASSKDTSAQSASLPRFHDGVAEAKRGIIRAALRQTGGHQTRAAELLGLTQPYLARLMKNLGLREG